MRAQSLTLVGARAPSRRLRHAACALGRALAVTSPLRCFASANTTTTSGSSTHRLTADAPDAEKGSVSLDNQPWCVRPSRAMLERLDVLTFLLGRYPREAHADGDEDTTTTTATTAAVGTPAVSSSRTPHARRGPQSRRRSLDALQSRGAATRARPHTSPSVTDIARPHTARSVPSAAPDIIRPMTPRQEAQRLAAAHRSVQALEAHQEAARDAAEAAARAVVLTHPAPLFEDEAAVLHRFGMGGRTSPAEVPGFHALFRQHWTDFWVTEMVPDYEAECGGRALSRDYNFEIPSLPLDLTDPTGEHAARGSAASHATSSSATEEKEEGAKKAVSSPDESFFQVDVTQRVTELRQEAASFLAETSETAHTTATALDHVAPAAIEPSSGLPRRVHSDASESPPVPVPTPSVNTVFASLAAQEAQLAAREAAMERDPHGLLAATTTTAPKSDDATPNGSRPGEYYLQCVLHKQHLSHSVALANIAQTLRIHPHAISVSGIKDFIGDTVQRVRLERVSPSAALLANRAFKKRGWHMHLSDFSYERTALTPGDLYGNHFKLVLRDVVADSPRDVEAAMEAFRTHGFPNYYGAQRFSWFGGVEDAGFALLRQNWLAFAFRFLNYTARERTLRDLLQRPHKYPHAVQDEYRRNVVRRLRQIAVEPEDLDEAPFLSSPSLHEPLTGSDGGPLNQRQDLVLWQLEQAYFDLQPQSRRLTAQRLSSYLWNQALTLRLHHFGGSEVLVGDHVLPATVRRQMHTIFDRQALAHHYSTVVTEANKDAFTIVDVVHPGFSFDGIRLPDNPVGAYYAQLCDKYRLDWYTRHSATGLRDFREPPRPIVRHPINLSYAYNRENATLAVEFALERGCYANVAVSELMKRARCAGSESIVMLPAPESTWDGLGERDPGYVTSMQDIYEGYEDGLGFTRDAVDVDQSVESEKKVWDLEGPLFLPDEEDPFRKAHAWGQRHLLSNLERRAVDAANLKRQLFEKPLADKLTEEELRQYAGHNIPLSPNMRGKKVFFKVLRRNRRYAGAPKVEPRLRRGATVKNRNHKLPAFRSLNKNAWNVSW